MKIKISLSPVLVKMVTDGLLTSVLDFRVSSSLLISWSSTKNLDAERRNEEQIF